ncbi:MAG TPA: hypothetical protein VMK12_29090 [Anaeromyxobacteraceae bacterium]|nr:hypothetical protein [Anaeromyxobacteraceae bacterium]
MSAALVLSLLGAAWLSSDAAHATPPSKLRSWGQWGAGITSVGAMSGTSAANGLTISGSSIFGHVVDGTNNGFMLSADKAKLDTYPSSYSASSITIGTFGSTPNSNGASASGMTFTGQPADDTHPGFESAADKLKADNLNAVVTPGSGMLGVNMTPTGAPIHSQLSDNTKHAVWLDGYSGASGNAPTNGITLRTARGTPGSYAGVSSGDQLGFFSVRAAYDTTSGFTGGSRGSISINATQTWTSSANGTQFQIKVTPNNATSTSVAATFDQDLSFTSAGKVSGVSLGCNSTDTTGTPGSATANTCRGISSVPGDSSTTAVTITNSLVTSSSTVLVTLVGSGGSNLRTFQVSPGSGSFVVTINAVVSSALKFMWLVVN